MASVVDTAPERAGRLPPQDLDAERSVLGAILLDEGAANEVMALLSADDFYRPSHSRIFDSMQSLFDRNEPIDEITVTAQLRATGQLDGVGGATYLASLSESVPTAANAAHYARIVRDRALSRRLINAATVIAGQGYEGGEIDLLLDQAESKIFEITRAREHRGFTPLKEAVKTAFKQIESLYERKEAITGVPTGFVDLDKTTSGLQRSDLIIIAGRPSMGKCLSHDAELLLTDGSIVTMAEAYRRREAELLTLGHDLRLRPTRPSVFVDDGVKPVYRVTTRLGRSVKTTASHPFLTLGGWKPLVELRTGEKIGLPRRLPFFGRQQLEEGRVVALATLLGDGWLARACRESTGDEPLTEAAPAPSRSCAANDDAPDALTRWLREVAVWGCDAAARHVPAFVFELDRPLVALFLSRLFATGGWASVSASGLAQLGYASVSERLARQVQHLLLRFGVLSALKRRCVRHADGARDAWQLDVTEAASVETFAAEIGISGQESAVAAVVAPVRGDRQASCDLHSVDGWALLAAMGATARSALRCRAGSAVDAGARAPDRGEVARLAAALGSVQLRQLATSDVYWDEIVSIEYAGEEQVYDLTIPETHNFVANDVCVHNTAFALNIGLNAAIRSKTPVAVFSLEMSKEQLVMRMLCAEARIESQRLRSGFLKDSDWPKLAKAAGLLAEAPVYIDDSGAISVLEMRAKARRLQAEKGLGLVIVDYLQLMRGRSAVEGREREISEISRGLKALAKELGVPVIALSQLNRSLEQRQDKRPMLSDLRESGAIEQDADVICFVYRDDYYNPDTPDKGIAEIIVGKQRNGPTDTVKLRFFKEYTRFESATAEKG